MPRTYVRHERNVTGVRKFKVYVPWWVDPYWYIQGSSIEKMVMAELVRRGIYFQHTPQKNTLGGAVDPTWEADFYIPQHKIWIECQGSYFHSLKGQIALDAYRYAAIAQRGWRPLFWWEYDIRTRLNELMDDVPEFYMRKEGVQRQAAKRYKTSKGLPFFEGGEATMVWDPKKDKWIKGTGIDHLKGLRAALAARRQPVQMVMRHRIAGDRKPK